MKIDLHCHTKKIKSGDPDTRNVTKDIFIEKLAGASVTFVAITNHNHFDMNQFKDFSNNDKSITIFPGVELDIIGKESQGHCLLITSPKNASSFDSFVKSIIGSRSADNFSVKIDEFINLVKDKNYIVIPHYSKSHSLKETDINYLINNLGKIPILLEPSNLRSAGIMIAHNKSTIIGSDVKDWDKYSDSKLPELKIPFNSYDQFTKLLKKDIDTIESFVQGKFAEEVHIKPIKYPDCDVKLKIYNDINVIFGGKGTGKTELILSGIKKHFEDRGYSDVSTYFPNDKDNVQEFDSLKVTELQESDLSKIVDENLQNDFHTINCHTTITITSTSEYYKWVNSEKSKGLVFGFSESTFTESLQVLKNSYDNELIHFKNSKEAIKNIKVVAIEPYLLNNDIQELYLILSKLKSSSWDTVVETFSKYQSSKLTEWSINKLKNLYQNKKGVRVNPTQTGFILLFENSLRLFNAATNIQNAMKLTAKVERLAIGNLVEKGTIYKEIEYSINPDHCKGRDSKYFNKLMNQTNLKTYMRNIDSLINDSFSINEISTNNNFKINCGQWNISKLSDLLLCNTRIVDEHLNNYDPSPGEKAMLLLNFKLMDDTKNVYILDEPEAKVGHKYISEVIIPRLLELAKRDKKIIITTHDANIAVRTLPLLSVYREQYREDDKPKYRTYIGSPFIDKMKCYEDKTKEVDWVKTSMDVLEGGEDAFIERGENYGR